MKDKIQGFDPEIDPDTICPASKKGKPHKWRFVFSLTIGKRTYEVLQCKRCDVVSTGWTE